MGERTTPQSARRLESTWDTGTPEHPAPQFIGGLSASNIATASNEKGWRAFHESLSHTEFEIVLSPGLTCQVTQMTTPGCPLTMFAFCAALQAAQPVEVPTVCLPFPAAGPTGPGR